MSQVKFFTVDVQISGEKHPRYITGVKKVVEGKDYIQLIRKGKNSHITFNKEFVVSYYVNAYKTIICKTNYFFYKGENNIYQCKHCLEDLLAEPNSERIYICQECNSCWKFTSDGYLEAEEYGDDLVRYPG